MLRLLWHPDIPPYPHPPLLSQLRQIVQQKAHAIPGPLNNDQQEQVSTAAYINSSNKNM